LTASLFFLPFSFTGEEAEETLLILSFFAAPPDPSQLACEVHAVK
jgi:hypothetical protein